MSPGPIPGDPAAMCRGLEVRLEDRMTSTGKVNGDMGRGSMGSLPNLKAERRHSDQGVSQLDWRRARELVAPIQVDDVEKLGCQEASQNLPFDLL